MILVAALASRPRAHKLIGLVSEVIVVLVLPAVALGVACLQNLLPRSWFCEMRYASSSSQQQ